VHTSIVLYTGPNGQHSARTSGFAQRWCRPDGGIARPLPRCPDLVRLLVISEQPSDGARHYKIARALGYLGTGVIDQILLSGANFLVGLLMLRYTTDVAYGQFVLAQSAVLLVVSAQGAWLTGPLTAIAPRKSPDGKKFAIGAIRTSQARFLHWVALVLVLATAAGYAAGLLTAGQASVAAVMVVAGWAALQREYLRSVLLIYTRPRLMLRSDAIYVICLILGILCACFVARSSGFWAICALAVAAWIATVVSYRMVGADPGWISGDARPLWQELRPLGLWAAVGAVIYWLFAQGYNFVLARRLDLTAVANVNAARLVLTPVLVFTIGINNVLMALAANWLAQLGLGKTLRRLALVLLAVTALDLVYMGFAWSARVWLITEVFHKTIADRDRLLLLWASITLIFLPREILQAVLFALRQVRSMAWVISLSALVSLSLMWFGIERWGVAAVLIGQIAGEFVNLLGLAGVLWIHVRRHGAQTAPPEPRHA
jgi:O-antigen/teichoic acid export membrane protein